MFFLFIIPFIFPSLMRADVAALPNAMSLKGEINAWNYALTEKVLWDSDLKKRGLMECAELKELKGTLLCAATSKSYMNRIFTRSTLFSEGGHEFEKGTIATSESKVYSDTLSTTLGHDIPSNELLSFWSEIEKTCSSGGVCPSSEEEEFYKEVILPFSQKEEKFVVISYSLNGEWISVLSHELLHAQYFLDSKYRETVDVFWKEVVRDEDKGKIKQILGESYNESDEFVMRNEFQAYLLQNQAVNFSLSDFVPLYREELLKKLTEAKAVPLEVK